MRAVLGDTTKLWDPCWLVDYVGRVLGDCVEPALVCSMGPAVGVIL